MTQEDKNLLLQDLCGRLPYGVIVQVNDVLRGTYDRRLVQIFCDRVSWVQVFCDTESCSVNVCNPLKECFCIDSVKPYLRPMSSITEEEREEYNDLYYQVSIQRSDGNAYRDTKMVEALHIDWLNKNMFDYRGLIPAGLANAAHEGMYNS